MLGLTADRIEARFSPAVRSASVDRIGIEARQNALGNDATTGSPN
jgi:hypothetical protein